MMCNKTKFEIAKRRKLHILEELNKLDILLESQPLSSDESSLKMSSLNKLNRIYCLEKIMWRQRAYSI